MNNNNVSDCPISEENWVLYLHNWISEQTTIALAQISGILVIFAFLGSIFFIDNIADRLTNSLLIGDIVVAKVYLIIFCVILFFLYLMILLIYNIIFRYHNCRKEVDDLIDKIINGSLKSNDIREEWRNLLNQRKKKDTMLKGLGKLIYKPRIIFWLCLFLPLISGVFLSEDNITLISLLLQILGVSFISGWILIKSVTFHKFVNDFVKKCIKDIKNLKESPRDSVSIMFIGIGLGFVISGLLLELFSFLLYHYFV